MTESIVPGETPRAEPNSILAKAVARWRRLAIWLSLFGAAIGALSAFENLVPTMVRLSMLIHGLAWLYRSGRDWLFGWVLTAFRALNVHVEISEVARDVLLVAGLIFAALNWESTRRVGRSLIGSLLNDIAQIVGAEDHVDPSSSLAMKALQRTPSPAFITSPLTFVVLAAVSAICTIVLIVSGDWIIAIVCVYVCLIAALHAMALRSSSSALKLVRNVSLVPALLFQWPFLAVYEGRRAVIIALAILGALIAANFAFLLWLDPLLANPPSWLQQFIDAKPVGSQP